jgi:hypothetical protein
MSLIDGTQIAFRSFVKFGDGTVKHHGNSMIN